MVRSSFAVTVNPNSEASCEGGRCAGGGLAARLGAAGSPGGTYAALPISCALYGRERARGPSPARCQSTLQPRHGCACQQPAGASVLSRAEATEWRPVLLPAGLRRCAGPCRLRTHLGATCDRARERGPARAPAQRGPRVQSSLQRALAAAGPRVPGGWHSGGSGGCSATVGAMPAAAGNDHAMADSTGEPVRRRVAPGGRRGALTRLEALSTPRRRWSPAACRGFPAAGLPDPRVIRGLRTIRYRAARARQSLRVQCLSVSA